MLKLSIMIPTTHSRETWNERIKFILEWQIKQLKNPDEVEIVWNYDNGEKTTGFKRNECIGMAKGTAMAFVDSDDLVCDGYIQHGIDFVNSGMDAASLVGLYFLNGVYDRPFLHSNKYTHWYQDDKFYYRNNNHLNYFKRDLVKHLRYENIRVGEDGKYSEQLKASGVIKTEFEIKQCLYLYFDRTKVNGI